MSDHIFPHPRAGYRAGADLGKPSVEVARYSARIALVSLVGEHDVSTKDAVLDALARACEQPCIVVDFSRCEFADSSVVSALVALDSTGLSFVRLVVPETQRAVWRTFELVAIAEFMPVHDSLEEALIAAREDDAMQERAPEVAS
jgi:anti-anti-sigma factor